jgi:hypothetical protein
MLENLLKLHEFAITENAEGDHILTNLVHHFLLAICTRPAFVEDGILVILMLI